MATHTAWKHRVQDGLEPLQKQLLPRYRTTERFRVYSSSLVPGVLQTEPYAKAVLGVAARKQGLAVDDSAKAAKVRVERGQVIHDHGRQFEFLLEEPVLLYQMAGTEAMKAQLNHLLEADALPTVSLGIIPKATPERQHWPEETFHIYDDRQVNVELVSADVDLTESSEVASYIAAFEALRSMAVYRTQARELVLRAIESLH
ncbi:DUF5753 domain-containing protein [Streptomyces sp. YS415]|uniref:DUF5753 domain-containing protein n=1 Tax=Streptomyces sp. YS415 TaxID=2944806 RepID=UPI002020C680|nr:DUF5753 domain-containing protein [Streptomyces sp. YS415]MCL7427702.1 DUF5753 domain-containing protein [Streptomyces sp. YS415]